MTRMMRQGMHWKPVLVSAAIHLKSSRLGIMTISMQANDGMALMTSVQDQKGLPCILN